MLPTPRIIDQDAVPTLRWGIVGTGTIAHRFVRAARRHTTQRIDAVCARDTERTSAFARNNAPMRAYLRVDGILSDPDIDAVYIATPHSSHYDLASAAIAAGKHVLVEKPLATTASDAHDLQRAGTAAGVLVMEAMWMHYLPQMDILRRLTSDGALGDIQRIHADIGIVAPPDPQHRLWRPELAGGALLDLGVYPYAFASSLAGPLSTVAATGVVNGEGIDLRSTAILNADADVETVVAISMTAWSPTQALIVGSEGWVSLAGPFFQPTEITLCRREGTSTETTTWKDTRFDVPHDAMSDQITSFAAYIGEGRSQSPLHPLSEVAATLATISRVREELSSQRLR